MTAIILSIKPKWAHKILRGEKKVEVRKTYPTRLFKTKGIMRSHELIKTKAIERIYTIYNLKRARVYLCETGSKGNITGHFELSICREFDLRRAPSILIRLTARDSKLSKEQITRYAGKSKKIVSWTIENPTSYATPIHISAFGLSHPPQSWCYARKVQANKGPIKG